MDKHDFSGIEVSARELIVAVEQGGRTVRLESFANDSPGHQAVLRFLRGAGHPVRAWLAALGAGDRVGQKVCAGVGPVFRPSGADLVSSLALSHGSRHGLKFFAHPVGC